MKQQLELKKAQLEQELQQLVSNHAANSANVKHFRAVRKDTESKIAAIHGRIAEVVDLIKMHTASDAEVA